MAEKEDKPRRKISIDRLIEILKSWKGPRPDYDNLDFSNWNQTEEEYQEEQRQWLEGRKGRKVGKGKSRK